jgi:hypothetical protein
MYGKIAILTNSSYLLCFLCNVTIMAKDIHLHAASVASACKSLTTSL